MRSNTTARKLPMTQASVPRARKPVLGFDRPGAFQCTILKALDLPRPHREVFLLKEIQGRTLTEIAAILGISIETAQARLRRARREIGHVEDSDARGQAQ